MKRLDGSIALLVAQREWMRKKEGERDTEFVKRIVGAYLTIEQEVARAAAPRRREDWHYDSQGYCDNPSRGY